MIHDRKLNEIKKNLFVLYVELASIYNANNAKLN